MDKDGKYGDYKGIASMHNIHTNIRCNCMESRNINSAEAFILAGIGNFSLWHISKYSRNNCLDIISNILYFANPFRLAYFYLINRVYKVDRKGYKAFLNAVVKILIWRFSFL